MQTYYYEPLIFDEKIAIKCGLAPFFYQNKNLLAIPFCGSVSTPVLDAYQALVSKTIDKKSYLFDREQFFIDVVGKTLTQEVLQALSN